MKKSETGREWLHDFEDFLKGEVGVPHALSKDIFCQVRHDLQPSQKRVLGRLLAFHAVGAGIVSVFCPQLGIGPLIGGHGIMHLFMALGPLVCAGVCGALFISLSTLFAAVFLSRDELRVVSRHRVVNLTLLTSLSFVSLMLMGGRGDLMTYLAWGSGAIAFGWVVLRLGAFVRLRPLGLVPR